MKKEKELAVIMKAKDIRDKIVWWLRSPGNNSNNAAEVNNNGWVNKNGNNVNNNNDGVRPASQKELVCNVP